MPWPERAGGDATGAACVPEDIAKCIDHTILKPDATEEDIKKLCAEAREFQFASVCISPSYIPLAAKELAGSGVDVCTVVGFPSGAHMPEIKAMETRRAIRDGATEIDIVLSVGKFFEEDYEYCFNEIKEIKSAIGDNHLKVILESGALNTYEEIWKASILSMEAGADFIKTSTGKQNPAATSPPIGMKMRE